VKNKYSIIIIPPDHSKSPRQLQFSVKGKKAIVVGAIGICIFAGGLFASDLYQAKYINEYKNKFAYVDQLELELKGKDLEIARLNEQSAEINNNLLAIASLEKKISNVLKFSDKESDEVSRGASLQSLTPTKTLDAAASKLDSHMEVMQTYYDETLKFEDKVNHTPSIMPVNGPISSPFGYRKNPFNNWTSEFHNGIDIACSNGTPVEATADGTVTFSGWDGYWGYKVSIDHGSGITTFYAHNSKLVVKSGDTVTKGEVISYSGSTGRSTGSHLHYGAYVNGNIVDPLIFTTYTEEQ